MGQNFWTPILIFFLYVSRLREPEKVVFHLTSALTFFVHVFTKTAAILKFYIYHARVATREIGGIFLF